MCAFTWLRENYLGIGLSLVLAGATGTAAAQAAPDFGQPADLRPPKLPGGGGDSALVRAIQLKVRYPPSALRDQAQGQGMVTFAVSPAGQVCLIQPMRPLRPDLDSAVVRAVRQLPVLRPAEQHGRPVACLLTAPVTFLISNPSRLPRKPRPALDSTQVYDVVTRMPLYLGQPTYQQLAADLVAEYLRRSRPDGCALPKVGSVSVLATVSPSGRLTDVQLRKTSPDYMSAYESRFSDQTARAEEHEGTDAFDDACLAQLLEAARALPRLTPAYVTGQPATTRLLLHLRSPEQRR